MVRKLLPLYITDSFTALESLVQKEDAVRSLKKTHKVSNIASRLKAELLLCQDDQEKCYILGKRYINLMDHVFRITDDKNYSRSLFVHDYSTVKELVANLREDLISRYESELKPESNRSNDINGPAEPINMSPRSEFENPIHKDLFIHPSDLIKFMNNRYNILLLDIRPKDHFQACRIIPPMGDCINIPEDIIRHGMTAHSLQQVLPAEVQSIWDRRDKYDIIIIIDNHTSDYYYNGSKLELLRSFIVDWDFNRKYVQTPVVLEGGLKAVIDCYPTKVHNPNMFVVVSDTNNEIDELLDLESVLYPEPGSGATSNQKANLAPTVNSMQDCDVASVTNDQQPDSTTKDIPNYIEGEEQSIINKANQLKDNIATQDQLLDTNEDKLRNIVEEERAMILGQARASKVKLPTLEPNDQNDEDEKFRGIVEEERSLLLNKARAVKPKENGVIKPPMIDYRSKPTYRKPQSWDGRGFVGLENIRNCCYMNCMLQCLKVIPAIKWIYVDTKEYIKLTRRKPTQLNHYFGQLMNDLWNGTEAEPQVINHKYFRDEVGSLCPMYAKGHHEDTFEFFMFLFNIISDDCIRTIKRPLVMTEAQKSWYNHFQGNSSFLIDSFYYQMKNTQLCVNCKDPNYTFEVDSTLMLSVPNRPAHLTDLIEDYLKQNVITEYSCAECKSCGSIVNVKEVVLEPEVLVVILKRGVANKDGTMRKNEVEIDFPLTNVKFGKSSYDLCAIVHHTGSLTHGHYFSSVLVDKTNDIWLNCNDERVTRYKYPVKRTPGIKSQSTGFFYIQRNMYYT